MASRPSSSRSSTGPISVAAAWLHPQKFIHEAVATASLREQLRTVLPRVYSKVMEQGVIEDEDRRDVIQVVGDVVDSLLGTDATMGDAERRDVVNLMTLVLNQDVEGFKRADEVRNVNEKEIVRSKTEEVVELAVERKSRFNLIPVVKTTENKTSTGNKATEEKPKIKVTSAEGESKSTRKGLRRKASETWTRMSLRRASTTPVPPMPPIPDHQGYEHLGER